MKNFLTSIRILLVLTGFLGIGYPLAITGIAQVLFPDRANGSIVTVNGVAVGSELLAQKFEHPRYFWPRPSAGDFNPLPSGGTNQGQTSAALKTQVDERKAKALAANPGGQMVPQDLLFTSGSGLDPHISPEAALFQVARVASARALSPDSMASLIKKYTEPRQFGVFGEPRINVLKLNLALDELSRGNL